MGGEQQNLVFIGTDGGSDQVLGIDQTLVKFEDSLVSGGSDPCDSLPMCRPQPGMWPGKAYHSSALGRLTS